MSKRCRLPPSKAAHPHIVIKEADPIKEPDAPGGEIDCYDIKYYDGRRWRSFSNVTHSELVEFQERLADLLDDPRDTEATDE